MIARLYSAAAGDVPALVITHSAVCAVVVCDVGLDPTMPEGICPPPVFRVPLWNSPLNAMGPLTDFLLELPPSITALIVADRTGTHLAPCLAETIARVWHLPVTHAHITEPPDVRLFAEWLGGLRLLALTASAAP